MEVEKTSVVFHALQYKVQDFFLSDDGLPYSEEDKWPEWEQRREEERLSQIIHTIYGNEKATGKSVAIGIQGALPSISLRLSEDEFDDAKQREMDENAMVNEAKIHLRAFSRGIFGANQHKKHLASHVLIDDIRLSWRKPTYFFHEHPSPFIQVKFKTSAAYQFMKRSITSVVTVQRNAGITDDDLTKMTEKVKLRMAANQTAKTNKKQHKPFQKEDILSKDQQANLQAKLDELHAIHDARQQTKKFDESIMRFPWGLYDGIIDPTVALLKSIDSRKQWFEVDLETLQKGKLFSKEEEDGKLALRGHYVGLIHWSDLKVRNDIEDIAPFMQCAFDIEAYSGYFVLDEHGNRLKNKDGTDKREFPDPLKPKNDCFQISMHFHRFGQPSASARQHLLSLGDPAPLPQESKLLPLHQQITVHRLPSERHLLLKFFELVDEEEVDAFLSYNGDNFDWHFIYHRAVRHGLIREKKTRYSNEKDVQSGAAYDHEVVEGKASTLLSRSPGQHVEMKYSIFSSGACGTTHYRRLLMPGRIHIDLLKYMRDQSERLPSYKLEFVLQRYLKVGKVDMPIDTLFEAYEKRDKRALAKVAEYCMIDSVRLQELVYCAATKIIESLISLSTVVFCPLEYIYYRGQQIKVFAQYARTSGKLGFAIPDNNLDFTLGDSRAIQRFDNDGYICNNVVMPQMPTFGPEAASEEGGEDETTGKPTTDIVHKKKAKGKKYEGAIVLEPIVGFYYPKKEATSRQTSETGASMKPDDRTCEGAVVVFDFASLYPMEMISNNVCYSTLVRDRDHAITLKAKGYEVDEHEWIDGETHQARYVGIVQNVPAILPTLLKELYIERKKIKKAMEFEEDPIRYNLLDKRQLAVKISLNSAYGFPASQMLPCGIISALVCYLGRSETAGLRRVIDALTYNWPGSKIVYGDTDSVFVQFDEIEGAPTTLGQLTILSAQIADQITKDYFRAPMCLEFEKIFTFFKLYSKKRYEGLKYEVNNAESRRIGHATLSDCKHDSKGVILQRRDSIPIAKTLYAEINRLHMLGEEDSMKRSVEFLRGVIDKILHETQGNLDLNDFSVAKKIQSSYQQPFEQPQSVVAIKMRSRGQNVQSNDYVKYVVLEDVELDTLPPAIRQHIIGSGKDRKQLSVTFRSEDMFHAIENNLTIDRHYYIQKIRTPVDLAFNLEGIPQTIKDEVASIFETALASAKKPKKVGATTAFQQAGSRNHQREEWGDVEAFGDTHELSDALRKAILEELSYFQHDHKNELKEHCGDDFVLRVDLQKGVTKRIYLGSPIIDVALPAMRFCMAHKRQHNRTATTGSIPFKMQISMGGIKIQCMKQNSGAHWPTKDELTAKNLISSLRSAALRDLLKQAHRSIHGLAPLAALPSPSLAEIAPNATSTAPPTTSKLVQSKKRKVIDKSNSNQQMTTFFTKKPKTEKGVIDMSI